MSYLRGSANYVWCTTSVLGKGATGAVFQGVSKHDGEPVAVKTFNQLSHMRPQEVQLREFEVLKKVKHENIVKLLAIEEEQDGRGKVIVMELCTGGSLYNLLDDPENTYGLSEDDFLLVLSHLSAGMKHLRDNNIVHRDLKPGNIMKFIAEDGQVVFKLTDFGAARELEEDQEFVSLYGTEEYLHPDMYERAVLRKPIPMVGKKTFSASVDLWSIGVTLYHVATGFLPFRPYGGRKNKEMMHFITTKKESGVISGCQHTENGQIEWKRELPNSCQISAGLKILITPLLAGLMEVDERKRWTYDVFFNGVSRIMAKTIVHLFYLNKIHTHRIYIDPDLSIGPVVSSVPYSSTGSSSQEMFQNFQKLIQEQTDIPPENQMLLHKEGTIKINMNNCSSGSTSNSPAGSGNYNSSSSSTILTPLIAQFTLPTTTEENPLILCDKENINVVFDWDIKDLPKFSIFPNLVNVENDASLAKLSCAVGYAYKRKIEKICLNVHLITVAVETIISVISGELSTVSKDSCAKIQSKVHAVAQLFTLMGQLQKSCLSFAECNSTWRKSSDNSENSISNSITNSPNSNSNSDKDSQPNTSASADSISVSSANFHDLDNLLSTRMEAMGQSIELQASQFRQLTQRLETLEQPINHLYSRFVANGSLLSEWRERSLDVNVKLSHASVGPISQNPQSNSSNSSSHCNGSSAASSISRAGKKAGTHVGKLRESWQHLLRDRATRSLTYNDEQFHILERIKMQAKSKCLSELLNEECQLVIVGLTEILSDWYKQAQAALIQTDILAKDMSVLENNVQDFLEGMDGRLESFQNDLEYVMLTFKDRQELLVKLQQLERKQQQQLHEQQEKEKFAKPNVQHKAVSVKTRIKKSSVNSSDKNTSVSTLTGKILHGHFNSPSRHTPLTKTDEIQFDSVALDMDVEIDSEKEPDDDEGQGSWNLNSNSNKIKLHPSDHSLSNNNYPNVNSTNINNMKMVRNSSNSRSSRSKGPSRMEQHDRTMRKGIKDLSVVQEEVWTMLKENAELLNQFQAMTLSLFSQEESEGGSPLHHGPPSAGDSSGACSRRTD